MEALSKSIPEYTALKRQRMKEQFDSLTPTEKERVTKAFLALQNPPKEEPPKPSIPTLTYKQIATQNFKGKKVENRVRRTLRNMNREKTQVRVVNKPGSVIEDNEGNKFLITSKGKSMPL